MTCTNVLVIGMLTDTFTKARNDNLMGFLLLFCYILMQN